MALRYWTYHDPESTPPIKMTPQNWLIVTNSSPPRPPRVARWFFTKPNFTNLFFWKGLWFCKFWVGFLVLIWFYEQTMVLFWFCGFNLVLCKGFWKILLVFLGFLGFFCQILEFSIIFCLYVFWIKYVQHVMIEEQKMCSKTTKRFVYLVSDEIFLKLS